MKHFLISFFHQDTSRGTLLIVATLSALVINNSPIAYYYGVLLNIPIVFSLANFIINKPLVLWVNDGLMTIFFLLVGLEIKREVLQGHLASPSQVILPMLAALGGMLMPAMIYWLFNQNNYEAQSGWAIPMATDIAFSLGILALLGKAVPTSLKLFLMALAIIDDLGAIIVIAVFYSKHLSFIALSLSTVCIITLIFFNRLKISALGWYLIVGLVLWVCVLKSGVHATVAGVIVAFTIPLKNMDAETKSINPPLVRLEQALAPWVSFFILPLFAFVNGGISFASVSYDHLVSSVTLGIIVGLLVGKTIGVFGVSWLIVKLGFAQLPKEASWPLLLGVSILCGVGFTMSIFIGSLAFPMGNDYMGIDKVGILLGSLLSSVIGYLVIGLTIRKGKSQRYSG